MRRTIPVAFICKILLRFYLLSRIVFAGGLCLCVRNRRASGARLRDSGIRIGFSKDGIASFYNNKFFRQRIEKKHLPGYNEG